MSEPAPGDVLAGLRRELEALRALDPAAWCDGATLVALFEQLARIDSLACVQSEAFRRSGEWIASGAQTAAAWVAVETHREVREVRSQLRRGRAVDRMGMTREAFAAGRIAVEHVDRLRRARTPRTAFLFDRDEAILVGWAESMHFDDFVLALDAWLYRADDDGAERAADAHHRRRRLHLSHSLEDTWYCNGVFDPISGKIISEVLSGIERELFRSDWAEAEQRLGARPSVDDLARTAAQRRADAMVEMATRAATTPKDGQRPRPLITILTGEESFRRMCELASGTFVTPGSAARVLDASVIERIVFDGPDRVMSVSHQRAFTGALRRAIEVRDRMCTHPYCRTPAEACAIDHILPYARGGPTSQANGRAACDFHNREKEPEHIRRRRARPPTKATKPTRATKATERPPPHVADG